MNDLHDVETRVTDGATGGQKGSKLARFDLLPVRPLFEVARLYGAGAAKYEDRNWERGFNWSLSFAALQRHALLFWAGEQLDPETQRHHLASVIFHAMALMEFEAGGKGTDDRPPSVFTQQDDLAAKLAHGGRLASAGLVTVEEMATRLRPALGVEQVPRGCDWGADSPCGNVASEQRHHRHFCSLHAVAYDEQTAWWQQQPNTSKD